MMQKKSANLMDGLSSEAFKKVGSSNLANAIKRAPSTVELLFHSIHLIFHNGTFHRNGEKTL